VLVKTAKKISDRLSNGGRLSAPEWLEDALDRTLPRAIRLWHAKLVAARMLAAVSPRSRWAAPMADIIPRVTPQVLRDLFWMMSDLERGDFLRLISDSIPAETIFAMIGMMDAAERIRFFDMISDEVVMRTMPGVMKAAVEAVRDMPQASMEELLTEVTRRHSDAMQEYDQEIVAIEAAKLKALRDRKSNPETILQNVQICDRHSQNPELTQGQLGKQFDMTPAAIRKILKEESKWRRLASRLRTN
jgi:hypothetical protein